MTTYRSSKIVERLKSTLLKLDLEIARVGAEITLLSEKMDLLSGSTKKKDLKNFALAKIEKENYEVYLNRIKTAKLAILTRVNLVIDKYEECHAKVFQKFYLENKDIDEIAVELDIQPSRVKAMVDRLDKEITEYVDAR